MQIPEEIREILVRKVDAQIEQEYRKIKEHNELLAEKLAQQVMASEEKCAVSVAIQKLNELADRLAAENEGVYCAWHFDPPCGSHIQRGITRISKGVEATVDQIMLELMLCQDLDAAKVILMKYDIV